MSFNSQRRTSVLVGFGLAAGGMLVATLGQLAAAPAARADLTDIIDSIESSANDGQTALGLAATDFSGADVPDGLANSFAGLDDYLIATGNDLVVNSYAAPLEGPGVSISFSFNGLVDAPTTLAATTTDVTSLLDLAQSFAADATTAFEGGTAEDIANGLVDFFASGDSAIAASQTGLIGLVDSTFGL